MRNWTSTSEEKSFTPAEQDDIGKPTIQDTDSPAEETDNDSTKHDPHWKDLTYTMNRTAQYVWKKESIDILRHRNYKQVPIDGPNGRPLGMGKSTPMPTLNDAQDLTTHISSDMVLDTAAQKVLDAKMEKIGFVPEYLWSTYFSG
jgi:hypothetical protein